MNKQTNGVGERLEDAFQLFNQFSEKLADSYGGLESHVAELTSELAEARSERLIQLAEKEVLAKRLAGLLDVLPAGIVVVDSDGYITQTNPIAREMMELNDDEHDVNAQHWENIAIEIFVKYGDELRLKDGRWINVTACPLEDAPGQIILISDVSETHKLQDLLNRQQRLSSLGEMIASLAHQIRTPLSSALLYISAIKHPMNDEIKKISLADKTRERLLHLERMVNDMLVFARGDVSQYEYVNTSDFIKLLKNMIEQSYKNHHIVFNTQTKFQDITIRANSDVLLSAIQNIIDNAIEACADSCDNRTKIELDAVVNNSDEFEVNIKDNGCGMLETTKDRVLEPFFTTRSNGTGLGLAVVNATINRYGGKMNIMSQQGMGSTFNIKFPAVEVEVMLSSNMTSADMKNNDRRNYKYTCVAV